MNYVEVFLKASKDKVQMCQHGWICLRRVETVDIVYPKLCNFQKYLGLIFQHPLDQERIDIIVTLLR
jgi:hypothetical protein